MLRKIFSELLVLNPLYSLPECRFQRNSFGDGSVISISPEGLRLGLIVTLVFENFSSNIFLALRKRVIFQDIILSKVTTVSINTTMSLYLCWFIVVIALKYINILDIPDSFYTYFILYRVFPLLKNSCKFCCSNYPGPLTLSTYKSLVKTQCSNDLTHLILNTLTKYLIEHSIYFTKRHSFKVETSRFVVLNYYYCLIQAQ